MKDLQFVSKGRPRAAKHMDVSLYVIKNGGGKNGKQYHYVMFYFYNDSWTKIIGNGNYMQAAIDKDEHRIYFRKSKEEVGFLVSHYKRPKGAKTCSFAIHDQDLWRKYTGQHTLQYDEEENLWYIEMTDAEE